MSYGKIIYIKLREEKIMFCKNCGADSQEGKKFCPKCGTPIQENVQSQNEGTNGPGSVNEQKEDIYRGNIEYQNKQKTKKRKKGAKFAVIAGIVVALVMVIIASIPDPDSDKYIAMVRGGYPESYADYDVEYGKVFNYFFKDGEWEYFVSDEDKKIVEFNGKCTYNDEEADAKLQFTIDNDEEGFMASYASINGVKYDGSELIETAFDEYLENRNQ